MRNEALIRFLRFSSVGCLGLIVDTSFVYAFVYGVNASPLWSRFPSWIIAVSVTYFFNLLFTFSKSKKKYYKKRHKAKRYFLYVSSQAIGGVVNITTYLALVSFFAFSIGFAMVVSTLTGLIFNYFGASFVVNKYNIDNGPNRS